MHRYLLLLILLLSVVTPPRVTAQFVSTESPCPKEMTMVMDDASAVEAQPCCDEAEGYDTANLCGQTNSCHHCKAHLQVYIQPISMVSSQTEQFTQANPPMFIVTVFNPASIWRPPNPA